MITAAKIHVLIDNSANSDEPRLHAEHGLSLLIDVQLKDESARILLDTGPLPHLLLQNAKYLNIDFSTVNAILLSHGHYDHVGGLLTILPHIPSSTPIIAHPDTFLPKFAYRPYLKSIGAPFSPMALQTRNAMLLQTADSVPVLDGVKTTGEIERKTPYEKVTGYYTLQINHLIPDYLHDDQALILHLKKKGLIVICGCAHSGLINTITHAKHVMKTDTVYAVIGGFHLKNATSQRIDATADALRQLNVKQIAPCHCTGSKAIQKFTSSFKQQCRPLRVGDVLTF